MRPFLRSRPAAVGLALTVVTLGGLGMVSLFAGPGYESSLAAGVLVPSVVAIATALELSTELGPAPVPFEALGRGVANGAAFALAAYLTTLLHGLRAGFCDLAGGSLGFALGPGAGALLAGAWGAVAAELARPRRRRWSRRTVAVIAGGLAPAAGIAVSVGRFYTSPMVFAYDPFAGFFSGSIYDTIVDPSGLLSYRAGTAATLLAGAVAAAHLERRWDDRLRLTRGPRRPGVLLLGALALAASLASNAFGDRLGYWQTAATIARALGGRVDGERCSVVYPSSFRRADVQRFLHDCDAHVVLTERWLEAAGPPRVTAYLFADAAQKGALMGAADTYIAKPWRREVYVQASGYPAPVLGHELVHVLAGSLGRGPFRIAGSLGGLLPDPGLIEGIAVAGSPPEGDLTPREWAKAMKDLGLLPPLASLFTLGFYGENGPTAYTVSGAFVGHVRERYGAAALRAWYGGRALPEVTGRPWADLERTWHADLDAVVLPEAARAQARARFDRPALFGRRCPHVVDACRARADGLRAAGDEDGAIAEYRKVQALDPGDFGVALAIAGSEVRDGRLDAGRASLESLAADAKARRSVRDHALEQLGDLALAEGRGAEAAARYAEVASRTVDEDQLRTLDVKTFAASEPAARAAVVALLVGRGGQPPDRLEAMELLGAWAATRPEQGLPRYLLARQYLNEAEYEEAARHLDAALPERGPARAVAADPGAPGASPPVAAALPGSLPLPRVAAEALRLRVVAACALGDPATAAQLEAAYARTAVGSARRATLRELVERCTLFPNRLEP